VVTVRRFLASRLGSAHARAAFSFMRCALILFPLARCSAVLEHMPPHFISWPSRRLLDIDPHAHPGLPLVALTCADKIQPQTKFWQLYFFYFFFIIFLNIFQSKTYTRSRLLIIPFESNHHDHVRVA
jgi:hypothetical protein